MADKQAYIDLCTSTELPLHMQPIWLDAVCGPDHWQVCLSYDSEGITNGALPYYLTRRLGLQQITMPPLTDYIGPWIRLPEEPKMKRERRYTLQQRILQQLVDQLPDVALFRQQYYPELDNWLPFYWRGYQQTTLYTYTFDDLSDMEKIYLNLKRSIRTDLKKADRQLIVQPSEDLHTLIRLYRASLQSRGQDAMPATISTLEKVYATLQASGQAELILALDRTSGRAHAGLLLVWDARRTYFLVSGTDPVYKGSAAVHLLYWHAIKQSSRGGRSVDFCGSILPGVEHVLRAYGARRRPHYRIFKARNRLYRLLAVAMAKDY